MCKQWVRKAGWFVALSSLTSKTPSSLPVLLICFDLKAVEGFFRHCGWVSFPQLCLSKFRVSFEREAPAKNK